MADIRQSVNQTTAGIAQSFSAVNETLNTTNQKFRTINNTTGALKSRWENLAEITTSIRNSFRIAQEVVNRLSAPLAQFSRYEDAAQRLAPLVGGMEKAKAIADKLRDSAANGTMSLEQLTGVAGRLASVFRSGDDVLKWTEAFHNLSAGTGLDVNELLGNFTKAKASGRFEAGFMDMFAQKGVNLYAPLARELDMSEAALRAAAKAGELEFSKVEAAILACATGTGQFAGAAEAMSGTFAGSVSTLRESWNTLLAEFGKPIAESLTPYLKKISELFAESRDAASGFGRATRDFATVAIPAALAPDAEWDKDIYK